MIAVALVLGYLALALATATGLRVATDDADNAEAGIAGLFWPFFLSGAALAGLVHGLGICSNVIAKYLKGWDR